MKIIQVLYRVKRYIIRPSIPPLSDIDILEPIHLKNRLRFPNKNKSIYEENKFHFLNKSHSLTFPQDWNNNNLPLLWLYNLHYFDGVLNPQTPECIKEKLINEWISSNPATHGIGWDPYPMSLRICNWIKWIWLKDGNVDKLILISLFQQTLFLSKKLEFHLFGNHLLENAKALIFAGYFFGGKQGNKWKLKGIKILRTELAEQILDDGGHFELSPMYHCIVLDLILDILQLCKNNADDKELDSLNLFLKGLALKMSNWLVTMCHSDQEISYFNDAAIGIAPAPKKILERVTELVGSPIKLVSTQMKYLSHSGFVRLCNEDAVLIMDVGDIGASYIPGHGHADTLSVELSLFSQRVLVNLGTSEYGFSDRRHFERGTSAHSTMEINDRNSSEVWDGFRVGRRAVVDKLSFGKENSVIASHNGYKHLPEAPRHIRKVVLKDQSVLIEDSVEGNYKNAKVYFHFHPSVKIISDKNGLQGSIELLDGKIIHWNAEATKSLIISSKYAISFGDLRQSTSLVLTPNIDKLCNIELNWK